MESAIEFIDHRWWSLCPDHQGYTLNQPRIGIFTYSIFKSGFDPV
jgi:hypothetical protein